MVLEKLRRKRNPTYLFYSGKGGVGKTSIAAATALTLARKRKVLIISVDPAHSLSDVFETRIGGDVKKIDKNLFAVEIDPQKSLKEYKEKLTPHIEKLEHLKGFGLEDTFDIAGMTPGIDEMAAFDKFLHYMHSRDYDVIIFDTAPTGHALRFLSLPDVLDSWIGKMIKIRMKLSGFANILRKILPFGEEKEMSLGTEQLDLMKKRIEEARQIMTDPKKTHYNIVTIPEEMSILENERALKTLESYKIPVKAIIVNQLIPKNSSCSFCTKKRKQQQLRLAKIQKKFSKFKIQTIPMFEREVKGMEMLKKLGEKLC